MENTCRAGKQAVLESVKEIETEFPELSNDFAGLIPVQNPNEKYNCTPKNTLVFARTGGNGVHFSLLKISEKIQPIVMTVPANFGNSAKDYNCIFHRYHFSRCCQFDMLLLPFHSLQKLPKDHSEQ